MSATPTPPEASKRVTDPQSACQDEFGDPKIAKRLAAVREDRISVLGLFRRIYAGKASARECIKGFCLECSWMDEIAIRECTATACPLHRRRPYQKTKATPKP